MGLATQNLRQFAPTPGLGQPVRGPQPGTLSVRINPSSSAGAGVIQVGSPLKLVSINTSGEIIVDLAGSTGPFFAVVPLNTKKNQYNAGDVLDAFTDGCILVLEASAAINAGDLVAILNTGASGGGPSVTTTTTPGTQVGGLALASIAAAGVGIVVKVKGGIVPGSTIAETLGTVTLNGATPVTVTQAAITATSQVLFTLKTVGGTVGAKPAIQTITPTTGFTVAGTALDTSVYNYRVLN